MPYHLTISSTAKAFDGEEVDFYVCNVGAHHVRGALDLSEPTVENQDLQRWLLGEDAVLVRVVARVVGSIELALLVEHYTANEEWLPAAKIENARASTIIAFSSTEKRRHMSAALALIEEHKLVTTAAKQLSLDIHMACSGTAGASAERPMHQMKVKELLMSNAALRFDALARAVALWLDSTRTVGSTVTTWVRGSHTPKLPRLA